MNKVLLEFGDLPSGTYFLNLVTGNQKFTGRFLVN
jgi:hypothetical protein